MKAYITKHALTKGIQVVEGKADDGRFYPKQGWRSYECCDFYGDVDDARARAEAMRIKELSKLERQIAKLEALDFSKPVEGE